MSTRAQRLGKSASVPRIVRRLCKKCGVVHPQPTGKKCRQVVQSFIEELNEESISRTSTPIQGTVNRIDNIIPPVVPAEVRQLVASATVVEDGTPPPPNAALAVLRNATTSPTRFLLSTRVWGSLVQKYRT